MHTLILLGGHELISVSLKQTHHLSPTTLRRKSPMCPSHLYILHFISASLIQDVLVPSEYLYICVCVCIYRWCVCTTDSRQRCLATGFTT